MARNARIGACASDADPNARHGDRDGNLWNPTTANGILIPATDDNAGFKGLRRKKIRAWGLA